MPIDKDDLYHKEISVYGADRPQLPYTLTKGVVATGDGLTGDVERIGRLLDITPERETNPPVVPWPDAAERLRYRGGEPWCREHNGIRGLACEPDTDDAPFFTKPKLHRLASILCDDGEAFIVLHCCVTHFGQEAEDG